MTHFKIVCTGWKNWPWIGKTTASIVQQKYKDYDVCIVDDASHDQYLSEFITRFCQERGWKFILQEQHRRALFNQVAAIRLMEPDPEDVIVFLDPDGDRFAHPRVLNTLDAAYADGTMVAYSKYRCDPLSPTSTQSRAHPPEVIRANSYREYTRLFGHAFNHLRSFRAEVFYEMDDSDFQDDKGEWFLAATDSALMFPAMELARGRVKFIDEELVIYRPDHPLSDWKRCPDVGDQAHDVILRRQPKCLY